ncbi:TPA: hypothetical protein DEP58_00435 [Patescibacteria group bacterium]|nr:MAG: NUDIX hydrolase [Parcubacteria group bacterium GW2011_GWD2_42_14]HCC04755.1 hypothetical protein [Patescibacteria group bacterium]
MELQVGVKVFLENKQGEFLLLHRNLKKYPDIQGTWDIVGGRIDIETPLVENLEREVFEETGLTITSQPRLLYAQDIFVGEKNHIVRLTYRATTEGVIVLDTSENDSCAWLTIDAMKEKDDLDIYIKDILDQNLLK